MDDDANRSSITAVAALLAVFVSLVECGLVFGSERVSEERKSGGFRVEKERERESIEIRSKVVAVVVCFWGNGGEGTRHAAAD